MNFVLRFLVIAFVFCGFSPKAYAVDLGDLTSDRVPATCDEDFWDVLGSRAWEGAQREVTQNANLLAKPDSVMVYSCFDRNLTHLANHADANFPDDPDESFDGSFAGPDLFFNLLRDLGKLANSVDPYIKGHNSIPMPDTASVLEILILDTFVNNVSILGAVSTVDDVTAVACPGGRNHYIENSTYDHNNLGGRTTQQYYFPDSLGGAYSCNRMAAVWDMARCYNAITEPAHDSYYTFPTYTTTDGNYRTLPNSCTDADDSFLEVACNIYFHGLPAIPFGLYWPWSGTPPLNWATANTEANPLPGAPGAVEPFVTHRNLYDPATCNTYAPIKTGVVVTTDDGSTYDDAYCMAPGCWYNPAVSTTQCQPY